ncbi:TPA: ModD protein [Raoultella ornithinolytica]|uniref:ModD protein n=1 Tax=Raoultella ornithinolytica TaxID=54291 RepID=UPI00273D919B|nr:ModD protein [Raoultella ornithinolytica]WLP48344.1 ModD protein [Raoultella ornithinolytica]HEC2551839.1 ModD protein [Raoultella ornithinolytica]HEC2604462.1 ModD protein [Raoultella ornithinolytica]HEC2609589.1 ModD protein [Raoultella ornithinolytica]
MIYIPQALTDAWLMEDIQGGDLTTRALGTGNQAGIMEFRHRQGGCVSGIAPAAQMLRSLGLTVTARLEDGAQARPGEVLLRATGRACAQQQGWKAVQNVLEWSCGVSAYVAQMLALLHTRLPNAHIACTRKAIPGTRLLGTQAIVAAGGLIHRAGCAETLLLFANHRRFLTDDGDWAHAIDLLRRRSPEKKVAVEADTPEEALAALRAQPDILQLDKFTPQQAREVSDQARHIAPLCTLALTGGMTLASLCQYLDCGIELFITSAPWYAPPADIQVRLRPDNSK